MKHLPPLTPTHCLRFALVLGSTAFVAPLAFGQAAASASNDDTVSLAPFTVTSSSDSGYRAANSISATKFATETKNIPLTVNVFTSDFIRDVNAAEVSDILRYAPDVNAYRTGYQDDFTYTIRGFAGAATVQLRNGIRKSGILDSAGMEHLEVVKGPSSVLNGQQSPGGLFNAVMKQPGDDFRATFSESIGSFAYSRSLLDINIPLLKTKSGWDIAERSVLADTFNGDWRNSAKGEKRYAYDVLVAQNLRTKTKFTFDTEYSQFKGVPARSLDWVQVPGTTYRVPVNVPWDFNQETDETFDNFRSSNVVVDVQQGLGDHWLFRGDYQYQRRVRDVGYYQAATVTYPSTLPRVLTRSILENFNQNWYFSGLGKYKLGQVNLQSLVGYEHIRGPFSQENLSSTVAEPSWNTNDPSTWNRSPGINPMYHNMAETYYTHEDFPQEAGYVLNQLEWQNRVYVSASVRYDDLTQNQTTQSGTVANFASTPLTYPQYPHNRAWSPFYGLLYRTGDTTAIYATYSKSFIANLTAPRGVDGLPEALTPTIGTGYETGIKNDFFGGKLSTTLGFFRIDETNVPHTVVLADPQAPGATFNATIQTGLERATGAEWNANVQLAQGLQLLAGYSYTDAHIIRNPQNVALQGLREQNSPRNKATLFTKYQIPRLPGGAYYVTAGYVYMGNRQGSADTIRTIVPSYSVFNVGLGWDRKLGNNVLSIRFNLDNAFDKHYWNTVVNASPGKPRSFLSSVSLRF